VGPNVYTDEATPGGRFLPERPAVAHLLKSCQTFYGTRRFVYLVHNSPALVSILSHMNPVHTLHPVYRTHILILFSHLRQGRPSGLFPFSSPTRSLYVFRFSPIHATCRAHLTLFDLIILIEILFSSNHTRIRIQN
jgi:hypothetical protein